MIWPGIKGVHLRREPQTADEAVCLEEFGKPLRRRIIRPSHHLLSLFVSWVYRPYMLETWGSS